MNIRQKWTELKTQLAKEMMRVNRILKNESDGTSPYESGAIRVKGQFVKMDLVVKNMDVQYLEPHCDGVIIKKANPEMDHNTWYIGMIHIASDEQFWVDSFLRHHCPLSLKEAEKMISDLQKLTEEKIHCCIDMALVEASR